MRYRLAPVPGFLASMFALGVSAVLGGPAAAQNLLYNGDFEQPLGPTNWTVIYVQGEANDFEIRDRTTTADRNPATKQNKRGGHFRPATPRPAHAYFSQTVSNLQAGHSYTIEGDVRWWGGSAAGFGNAPVVYRVYFDALGGTPGARSPDVPDDGIDGWLHYSVTQTPDASGKIEVRLHLDKYRFTLYDKSVLINGYFDNFSLTY